MVGTIRCSKCDSPVKRDSVSCSCGSDKVYITLYAADKPGAKPHHGRYWRDKSGSLLDNETAIAQLYMMNMELNRGTFIADNWKFDKLSERFFSLKIDEWLEEKLHEVATNELAQETYRVYDSYNRCHYLKYPEFHNQDVRAIDYKLLKRFYENLPLNMKKKMKRNVMNCLHTFFKWLKREGVIEVLPDFPIIKGKDGKKLIAISYASQIEALCNIPVEHRDIICMGFDTGVRPGELCALKVKDVCLEDSFVWVRRTYSGKYQIKENTKTNEHRLVPLSNKCIEIVRRNMADKIIGEMWLFTNPSTGKGYKPDYVSNKLWKKYSGMDVTFYEASRHSFITQMIGAGVPEPLVQAIVGHKSVTSTQHYKHFTVEHLLPLINRRSEFATELSENISIVRTTARVPHE
jgi:integrase